MAQDSDLWGVKNVSIKNPIEIRANRLELRRKEHIAKYVGDVMATQREYRLMCRQLEVHWHPVGPQISKIVARGAVRLQTDEGVVTAGLAVFDVPARTIVLTESPRLTRGEESVEGDRIVYSIDKRTSTVYGGMGKRVKARMIPKGKR